MHNVNKAGAFCINRLVDFILENLFCFLCRELSCCWACTVWSAVNRAYIVRRQLSSVFRRLDAAEVYIRDVLELGQ